MSGFCWKCREEWNIGHTVSLTGIYPTVRGIPASYAHCHHEPKEKPISPCWCELKNPQPEWNKYLPGYPNERFSMLPVKINFCPECGKKLKDWNEVL